jgi:hypothetical protein
MPAGFIQGGKIHIHMEEALYARASCMQSCADALLISKASCMNRAAACQVPD